MPADAATYDPRPAATRLAAVQAVYELNMMEAPVDDVLAGFIAERWQAADTDVDAELARPKPELLKSLVRGVNARRGDIDAALAQAMSNGRDLGDIEAVLRAILQTATFELLDRPTVPARTILSAYSQLGDAFFDSDGPQAKLIAGILNTVARSVRPDDFNSDFKAAHDARAS